MIIWISGELQADIGEAYRLVRNDMERLLNSSFGGNDYSSGQVVKWALIPTILNPQFLASTGYKEIRKYHKKRRVIEFRLRIDHAAFKAADDAGKRRLIFAVILRSVDDARHMKIPAFDLDRFERDLREIGEKHDWF